MLIFQVQRKEILEALQEDHQVQSEHLSVSVTSIQTSERCSKCTWCVSTGVDGESFSPGDDSVFDPTAHKGEGSNLVVSLPFHQTLHPTLLDLPRDLVHTALFESYTYTGIWFITLIYLHSHCVNIYCQ